MSISGGKKAFVSLDVSCLPANALVAGGASGPSYNLIQLDENPARPKYGYLILGNDPKNPGQKVVDVFTGTEAQIKKLCGEKSKGLIAGNRSLLYSDELSKAVSRYGYLTIPLNDGKATYDTVRLYDLLGDGAGDLGFELGDDGLVDASSLTFSYARSSFSEKFHNPGGWLGVGAGIALLAVGGPVVIGGLAVAGIASAGYASNEYSAVWDRGASNMWRAKDALRTGDCRAANLHFIEAAMRRGDVFGAGADFVFKTGVMIGAGRSLPAKAASARTVNWIERGRDLPANMPGSPSGYIPGATKMASGPGGLQTIVTVREPMFLPPVQKAFLAVDTKSVRPILVPDTSISASSPLPAVIVPPFYDPRDDGVVRYEMPSGEARGPFFAPGFDKTKEAIGDRPEEEKPIGDAPTRAEQIGDPKTLQNTIFAPGVDNKTRFVAGDEDDAGTVNPDGSPAPVPQGETEPEPEPEPEAKSKQRANASLDAMPDLNDREAALEWIRSLPKPPPKEYPPLEDPDWGDPESVVSWIEGKLERLHDIEDEDEKGRQLAEFDETLRGISSGVLDWMEANLSDDVIEVFSALIAAEHPYALGRVLEIAGREDAATIDGIPSILEDLVSPAKNYGLAKQAMELMFRLAERGSVEAARSVSLQLSFMTADLFNEEGQEKKEAEKFLVWATRRFLMAKIPLPERPSMEEYDFDAMPVGDMAAHVHLPSVRKLAQLAANGDDEVRTHLINKLSTPLALPFLHAYFGSIIGGHPQIAEVQRELFRIVRAFKTIVDRLPTVSGERPPPVFVYFRFYARFLVQTINASSDPDKAGQLAKLQLIVGDDGMRYITGRLEQESKARSAPETEIESKILKATAKLMALMRQDSEKFGSDFSTRIDSAVVMENRAKALAALRELIREARNKIGELREEYVEQVAAKARHYAAGSRREAIADRRTRMAAYAAAQAARERAEEPALALAATGPVEVRQVPAPAKEPTPLEKAISEPPDVIAAEGIAAMTGGRVTFENGGWRDVVEFYERNPAKRSSFFATLLHLLTPGEHANVARVEGTIRYAGFMRIPVGKTFRMIFDWREGTVIIKAIGHRGEIYKRR